VRARDVMTRTVLTVQPDTEITKAAAILVRRGFSALPVVNAFGDLVGIVTEADIIGHRFAADTSAGDLPRVQVPRTVSEVMTAPVVGLSHDTDLAVVARSMVIGRRRSMPILDGRKLVGVITRRDIVKMLTRTDADIADDVRKHLQVLGGPARWTVQVTDGEVVVTDQFTEAADRPVAKVLAEAVAGVIRATVVGGATADANPSPDPI